MNIEEILESQRAFFKTGATLPVEFRIEQLNKLYAAIKNHEDEIEAALKSDLGKSDFEGFMCETGLTLTEITYMLKHVRKFAGEHRVRTLWLSLHRAASKSPRLTATC